MLEKLSELSGVPGTQTIRHLNNRASGKRPPATEINPHFKKANKYVAYLLAFTIKDIF